jgi:hypothetical protein
MWKKVHLINMNLNTFRIDGKIPLNLIKFKKNMKLHQKCRSFSQQVRPRHTKEGRVGAAGIEWPEK